MSNIVEQPEQQSPMGRVLANFGLLLRGRGIAGVMLFLVTTLIARTLGPTEFGIVVVVQTYALLTRGLLNFQLFDAIVRFGVPEYDANNIHKLRRLIHLCFRVDIFACVGATIAAVLLAPLVGPQIGMKPEHVYILSAYSLVLLASTGNGTSIGVLRLFDQFDTLGRQMTIGPLVRFVGVVFAWWFDATLPVFMIILAIGSVSEDLYLNWFGWREYKKSIGNPQTNENIKDVKMSEFIGLKHFLWVSYWQSNIDLLPKHLSIILAGYLLGPAEAGLLRLARQFSSLVSKPAILVRQVVFLDLTRSWNDGSDAFRLVAYRTALLGIGFGMLFVLAGYFFGEIILDTLVGKEFVAAAPVLTLMLLAATFDLGASSLRSAAYAMGHAGKVLVMYGISAVVYMVLFVLLSSMMGLIGAGVATCVAAGLPPLAMAYLIHISKPPIPLSKK